MFSAVNLFTSLAFYVAQSVPSPITLIIVPPAAETFYFCEILVFGQVFRSHYSGFDGGFAFKGCFDADSLAKGCDEREEGDFEHNF